MLKWFKGLFVPTEEIEQPKELVTISNVEVFDTVWVKDEDIIHKGWIFDKTKKSFTIVAGENEYIFHYKRPYDQTEIVSNNKILYLNNPCDF